MEYLLSDLRKLPLQERLEIIESVLSQMSQEKYRDDSGAALLAPINAALPGLKRGTAPPCLAEQ
ncbi:MAG TPA: hypothetical protein VL092_08585 [Chitinophagaceae bacterium]|nr:hypothetical protein [Chitinophagaceae bacterium]